MHTLAMAALVVLSMAPGQEYRAVPTRSLAMAAEAPVATVRRQERAGARKRALGKQQRVQRGANTRKHRVGRTHPPRWELLGDTLLGPGVRYQCYQLTGRLGRRIHVVRVDGREPTLELKLIPALPGQRETLTQIVQRYDTLSPLQEVVAAVNGYFWSRQGLPVGLAATDGEVLQLERYKRWSAAVLDGRGSVRLDTFLLRMWVRFPQGVRVPIRSVNTRRDSAAVVLYTRFAGDTVPRRYTMVPLIPEAEADSLVPVVEAVDTLELGCRKLRLRYLRSPFLGGAVPCQVLAVDTGAVAMPLRGCVLSLGKEGVLERLPVPGDTVWLESEFSPAVPFPVRHVWSGTPRLVRDGRVRVEAEQEGTTSVRFLSRRRARTAVGVTRRGELLLVMVEHSQRSAGATVWEVAQWMRRLGAYHALNLDGGSSSALYVRGRSFGSSAPVASALAVVQRRLRSAP